jgi:hypothetical protein
MLRAIKDDKLHTSVIISDPLWDCNFFRTHIKDFAKKVDPLFRLTQKDSGFKG